MLGLVRRHFNIHVHNSATDGCNSDWASQWNFAAKKIDSAAGDMFYESYADSGYKWDKLSACTITLLFIALCAYLA